jgi:hypothetical protein
MLFDSIMFIIPLLILASVGSQHRAVATIRTPSALR